MTSDDRHRRMDAARVRAELTVQDLWLRYLALGGTSDAFDLDGYLQALVPLEVLQQDVLAQALNEALEEGSRSYRIPLSTLPADADADADATTPATIASAGRSRHSSTTSRPPTGPDPSGVSGS